jgi:hypothetical protein
VGIIFLVAPPQVCACCLCIALMIFWTLIK